MTIISLSFCIVFDCSYLIAKNIYRMLVKVSVAVVHVYMLTHPVQCHTDLLGLIEDVTAVVALSLTSSGTLSSHGCIVFDYRLSLNCQLSTSTNDHDHPCSCVFHSQYPVIIPRIIMLFAV